jgi:hypothetical protein
MPRDKSKDDKYFNCSEDHELKYISGHYDNSNRVYTFLLLSCFNHKIKGLTHLEVYQLIKKELGFNIPV